MFSKIKLDELESKILIYFINEKFTLVKLLCIKLIRAAYIQKNSYYNCFWLWNNWLYVY